MNPRDIFDLKGKTAIITGAAAGLGRTMAEFLAAYGANVTIADLDMDGAEQTAGEIRDTWGVKTLVSRCDVSRLPEIQQTVDDTLEEMGGLDILVNNAGINIRETALEVSEDHWDRILSINLKGVFFFAQAAGRFMSKQGSGKIINMASIQGVTANMMRTAYCASKGGVIQTTKQLAVEWAGYNIQVNAIAPSFFVTPMNKPLFDDEEFSAFIDRGTPLGRPGQPEELGGAVVFLASAASNFVTGHTLMVDGGWTIT